MQHQILATEIDGRPNPETALLYVGRIAKAETLQDAWRLFCEILLRWGFDQVNYGLTRFRVGDNIGSPEDILYMTSLPPERARAYFDSGFYTKTATFRRFRRAHPLSLSALKAQLETGDLPVRARIYTAIFKPGMKLFTVRAEPWHQSPTSPESIPPSDS